MYDSVYVFAKGLSDMNYNYSIKPMNLSCDVEKPWDDGLSLYNYLDSVVSRYIFLKPPPRPRGDILTDKK
jgi:hypothetical protein